MRICIIGGGPAGLCTLFALKKSAAGHEVVLYDKQPDFGGMWIFTAETGTDARGGSIPSAMYADLYINNPKEVIELPQFTFAEAFDGVAFPSFPPREVILEYYRRFAVRFRLAPYARFNTYVDSVRALPPGGADGGGAGPFAVKTRHVLAGDVKEETFDRVVVCTGHFTTPHRPTLSIGARFPGHVMHAAELRDLRMFAGQRVLVVGRSYSAESVVLEAHKACARRIVLSFRSRPNGRFAQLEDAPHARGARYFAERPEIECVDGGVVRFKDGSEDEFDLVVLCTGYKHYFPFMEEGLRLDTDNNFYPDGLYKGVVLQRHVNVACVGMQVLIYTNTLFMTQALWLARLYTPTPTPTSTSASLSLPPLAGMKAHTARWRARMQKVASEVEYAEFQTDHLSELAREARAPDVDVMHLLRQFQASREDDMLAHRNGRYTSKYSGVLAAAPGVPWLEASHAMWYMGDAGDAMRMSEFHERHGGVQMPKRMPGVVRDGMQAWEQKGYPIKWVAPK